MKDARDFEATLSRVLDPRQEGRRFLPPGISHGPSITPQHIVTTVVRQQHAIRAFQADKVDEALLEQVRHELQETYLEYLMQTPLFVPLGTQQLREIVGTSEVQARVDKMTESIWLVLGALLDNQNTGKGLPRSATQP